MEITLKPRGNVWSFSFYMPDGERKRLSTGLNCKTVPEEVARAEALKKVRDLMQGTYAETPAGNLTTTLGAALDAMWHTEWKHQKSARETNYRVLRLRRLPIAYMPVTEVSSKVLMDYREQRLKEGKKPATINRDLSCIGKVLKYLCQKGELGTMPYVPYLEEDNITERYMEDHEEKLALDWIDRQIAECALRHRLRWQVLKAFLILLLDTGVRMSELLGVSQFNLRRERGSERFADGLWLKHGTTKNGKGRVIPLTDRAAEALKVWLQREEIEKLRSTQPIHKRRNWCIKYWSKVRKANPPLADLNIHKLRHTCASRLLDGDGEEAAVELFEVGQWLGHRDLKTTQRYAHLAKGKLAKGARLLERRAKRTEEGVPECAKDGTKG